MTFLEILVIILAPSYVLFILGTYIYKRIKGLPTGECSNCKLKNANKNLIKYFNKHKDEFNL